MGKMDGTGIIIIFFYLFIFFYFYFFGRKNDLPGLITWHACCKVPISESSSRLSQALWEDHCCKATLMWASLSAGSRRTPAAVSISIPRNVMQSVGPSSLSSANGIPRPSHILSNRSKAWPQTLDSGGPTMIKCIKVVINHADTPLLKHPLHRISNCSEYFGSRTQAERQHAINIVAALPFKPQ